MRDASWFKEGKVVVPCTEHFVLFYFISFYIFHIWWKYFKDGWVYFPRRTNRKSGSPIIHIATANVEAAETVAM